MLYLLIPLMFAGLGLVAYDVAKPARVGSRVVVDDEVEISLSAVPYETRVEWVRVYGMPVETKSISVSVMGANETELDGMVTSFNQPKDGSTPAHFYVIRGKAPTLRFKRSAVTSVTRAGKIVVGATETFTSSLGRPSVNARQTFSAFDLYSGSYTAQCFSNRADGRCHFYGGTGHTTEQSVPNGTYIIVLPHAAASRPDFTYVRSYYPGVAGYLPNAWIRESARRTLQRRRLF